MLPPSAAITLAEARSEHVAAMLDIYAVYVLTSLCTFEEVPPSLAEMHRRLDRLRRAGLPWLVALEGAEVIGYAYAALYRTRSAYNGTVESSIYVSNRHHGKGVGKRLMSALVEQCRAQGYMQMVAVIGDSGNLASVTLHRKLGFQHIGTLRNVGRKFDCLVDTVLMQLPLAAESVR
ncbi:GNAT family N-acetyltransferase [Herbaspirillum sp. DW155]|uniref:GNAT family N-acetyltransferase n=1 Tax=Herbaspirillum sp. DW155 TaxID=3095609 RepID=UPI00308E36AB|nr:GNAT family N-acetyltransferase [Herbaspirillum sp. DW155]